MAVFDDMELERKITVYDKTPEEPAGTTAVAHAHRRHLQSEDPHDEPLKLECHFRAAAGGWEGREMHDGLEVVRARNVDAFLA
jgi:hypothetical protein